MKTETQEGKSPGTPEILIPIGERASKNLITQALHVLSAFKSPLVLFYVVEVPSRTATLDTEPYRKQIEDAERRLNELSMWLVDQGLRVRTKVVIARNIAEGIIDEADSEDYLVVFMMKRKTTRGLRRIFTRSVSQDVVRRSKCFVMTAPLE